MVPVRNSRGRILRDKEVGPFRIIEKSYDGSVALPRHQHPTGFLSFLLAGAYVEASGNAEMVCPSGTVIWHPPSEIHSDRFHPRGGHLIDLEVRNTWLQDASLSLHSAAGSRVFSGGLPYSLGLQLYRQLSGDSGDVEDTVTELLSFFFSGDIDRHPPKWFQRALQLVSETQGEHQSLAAVARAVAVHPVHLARSFRRFVGCTFGDYQLKLRLRTAFEMLLNPKQPVVDIAYACGFADHAHLCRIFKKSTGLTPSAFRSVVSTSL